MEKFELKRWETGFKSYSLKDLKITKEKDAVNTLAEWSNDFQDEIGSPDKSFEILKNSMMFSHIETPIDDVGRELRSKNLFKKKNKSFNNYRSRFPDKNYSNKYKQGRVAYILFSKSLKSLSFVFHKYTQY